MNDSPRARSAWLPILAGGVLICAGLLANQWSLARVLSPDGELSPRTRLLIGVADAALILSGVVLIFFRQALLGGVARGVFKRHPNVAALIAGLVMSVLVVGLFEGAFFVLNRSSGRPADIFRQGNPGDYAQLVRTLSPGMRARDPLLGHRPEPNATYSERLTKGDDVIYDVTYTIDGNRCRTVPQDLDAPADRFIAFAGCSFAFGTGVADGETLPAQVAARTSGVRAYNLANPGDGPHQTLAILREWDLSFIKEKRGTLIYVFIPQHISRAACTMLQSATYGRYDPAFDTSKEPVVYLGPFAEAFPVRTAFYDLLYREQALRWLGRDWPPAATGEHIRHSAKLLAAAAERFAGLFESDGVHVLLHPLLEPSGVDANLIRSIFAEEGLHLLDYESLFEDGGDGLFFPYDQHPTAKAHARVAEKLIADLALPPAAHRQDR